MTISTEQFIAVNVGTTANDGNGDSLRAAFIKVNENFDNIETIGFSAANIAVAGDIEVDGYATIQGTFTANANVIISNVYVPTANTSPGSTGQITWDNDHVYICIAGNNWKRANLAAW
jgi:hypothetical protein